MEKRLINIINNENKKTPLTDEEIAEALNTSRERVTNIRLELGIPDSRERRRPILEKDITNLLIRHGDISLRSLAKLLNDQGYSIGKYAVGKLKEEILESMRLEEGPEEKPQNKEGKQKEEAKKIFSCFIGYDGSLRNQISRAQAAVLYPPKGLHTLIYGPSGVGKSLLAELMHRYAIKTENFKDNAPYFEFNCADYADNPQLLLAQLFGYVKGAFTGANENKKGVVELCDGGILFLDEVHRLSPEGQEMLFYLIDKGRVRRLGEVDSDRVINVMIIAATTENPESSLLLTFRRRIPMIIELPAIKDRPLYEVLNFVKNYFMEESHRLGRVLHVKEEVMRLLTSSDYQGNVGQLKSDIQVCCAKAFLDMKLNRSEEIVIGIESLSEKMRIGDSGVHNPKELNMLIRGDEIFTPNDDYEYDRKLYKKDNSIYTKLEIRYEELKKQGASEEEINSILSGHVEETLLRQIQEVEESQISIQEISNIVGDTVLSITKEVYDNAKKLIPTLKSTLIFPLALHISMAIERYRSNYRIVNPPISLDRKEYEKELQVAIEALELINRKYYLKLPDEEISFFTMYFHNFQEKAVVKEGVIGLLVVSHGRVACGMAEVANTLMGVDHAIGLEMDFKDSPKVMIDRVIKTVKRIDQGKGCIILADMGSLVTMKEKVEKETGVTVGIVGRTDTVMVMECIRKVLWTSDTIDKIVESLELKSNMITSGDEEDKKLEKAILCLCITGEGAAKKIKQYLENRLKSTIGNIKIITKGYIESQRVEGIIKDVESSYKIIAIVGTIDPQIDGYPFYSSADIMAKNGTSSLRKAIKRNKVLEKNDLGEVITKDSVYINPPFAYKDEVLDNAVNHMIEKGDVKPEFLLSIYKREGLLTTYLKGGIAIPHGDTQLVTKTAISVTKLDNPIIWDGMNTVDIIFVLALKEDSKKYFEQLYEIISDERMMEDIRRCNTQEEILNILCQNTLSDK